MSAAMNEFLKKYNLTDAKISSYDDATIQMITDILDGNISEENYANCENSVVLIYICLYYECVKEDHRLAEKYCLMAIENGYNNSDASMVNIFL